MRNFLLQIQAAEKKTMFFQQQRNLTFDSMGKEIKEIDEKGFFYSFKVLMEK